MKQKKQKVSSIPQCLDLEFYTEGDDGFKTLIESLILTGLPEHHLWRLKGLWDSGLVKVRTCVRDHDPDQDEIDGANNCIVIGKVIAQKLPLEPLTPNG
jgi:hypothetical protein